MIMMSLNDLILGLVTYISAFFSAFVLIHGIISALLATIHSCSSPMKSRLHRTKAFFRLFPIVVFIFFPLFINYKIDPVAIIRTNTTGALSLITYFASFLVKKVPEIQEDKDSL